MNQKAIIIGASSGIGKELAKVLSNHGFIVGLTGRRIDLLIELQSEIKNNSFIKQMDISALWHDSKKSTYLPLINN